MDGIKTIKNMVTRNCFMVTIDLKDTYHSALISRLSMSEKLMPPDLASNIVSEQNYFYYKPNSFS